MRMLTEVVAGHHQLMDEGLTGLKHIICLIEGITDETISWEMPVVASTADVLWVYDAVMAYGLISKMTMLGLLHTYREEWHNATQKPSMGVIAVSDRRYVRLPWQECWYDVVTGQLMKRIAPTVEGVTYNMDAIVKKALEIVGDPDGSQPENEGIAAESRD